MLKINVLFYFIAAVHTCARQEIILQQNYMCVAFANLHLSHGVLLTYLATYLLNLSQHYDGDVDVM